MRGVPSEFFIIDLKNIQAKANANKEAKGIIKKMLLIRKLFYVTIVTVK